MSRDWIKGYSWGYRLMWAVFTLMLILGACAQTVELDTADAVCDEIGRVIPSFEEGVDSPQTVAEVRKLQDVFVGVCEG